MQKMQLESRIDLSRLTKRFVHRTACSYFYCCTADRRVQVIYSSVIFGIASHPAALHLHQY